MQRYRLILQICWGILAVGWLWTAIAWVFLGKLDCAFHSSFSTISCLYTLYLIGEAYGRRDSTESECDGKKASSEL